MIKMYYTCPIEAAYMAKNFGVRYTIGMPSADYNECGWYVDADCEWSRNPEYIINPDSLSIFEPQEGDLVEKDLDIFQEMNPEKNKYVYMTYTGKENFLTTTRIIQRNGKPFIMPQKEQSDD